MTLPILDARIDLRANATRTDHPWWPCAEGCDRCCRSLPRLPSITEPEWRRLRQALAELPPATVREIEARMTASAQTGAGPVVCPLLDRARGACLVYAARPIACRTYGFYAERDAGLHCAEVGRLVEEHDAAVLWGNGEAVAADMKAFGPPACLSEWMSRETV